jgi:hypothetical protein
MSGKVDPSLSVGILIKNRIFWLLKLSFVLVLVYVTMEAWAQWRFSRNCYYMPMGIRKNLALNSLEAFRLTREYEGQAQSGMKYKTDAMGFRVSPEPLKLNKPAKILLGGDSRIFGYALAYKDTLGSLLEQQGYFTYQQAFPGASPAMFNEQMFQENLMDHLASKPQILFYGYDREDLWNDQIFRRELNSQQPGFSWRWLKVKMGGYLWGMGVQKFKSFLARDKGWPEWIKKIVEQPVTPRLVSTPKIEASSTVTTEAVPSVTNPKSSQRPMPISSEELKLMKRECEARGIRLTLMYLPRFLELLCQDDSTRNNFKTFCESEQLLWIDFYQILLDRCQESGQNITSVFLDANEGIHFSRCANEWISDEIQGHIKKVEPLELGH